MQVQPKAYRLFFALWPDEPVRAALAQAARKAVRVSGGRPVPLVNWHTTLAFLGSVSEERMAAVAEAAASVDFTPFQLRIDKIEHWTKAAVLALVASSPPREARELARHLQDELVQRGFTPDFKPWRAHVTIARKVVKPHSSGAIESVEWKIENFVLVESETLPERPRYTVLERWPKPALERQSVLTGLSST